MSKSIVFSLCIIFLLNSVALGNTCTPQVDMEFMVQGVSKDDTLNVRSGPTTNYPIVTELRHNEEGIRYGGDRYFLNWECQRLCRQVSQGNASAVSETKAQCFQRNQVWFEIVTPSGISGWVSAKYLDASKASVPENSNARKSDSSGDVSTPTGDESYDNEFREFMILRLILELCYEGQYLSETNWSRIEGKYEQTVSSSGLARSQIQRLRKDLKGHDAYQIMLMGLVSQNGGSDPYWQDQCNGITSAYLFG